MRSNDATIIENNGQALYNDISSLIEENRRAIYRHASGTTVMMFWEIGRRINSDILENKRADYGKQIVSRVATQLTEKYGCTYELRNLRRMMQFNEQFPAFEIVSQPATQLSWAHIVEILPLKTTEAKMFYLNEAARGLIGRDGLRIMIKNLIYCSTTGT